MILVVVKQRMTSPEAVQEICRLSRQAYERSQRPGWLGGWCVVSTTDPLLVVIVEEWGSRLTFEAWYNSPPRIAYERQAAPLRVGEAQIEIYEEV
jgi:quinol monooxygenase YgiN